MSLGKFVVFSVMCLLPVGVQAEEKLQVGLAETDISPPVGFPMAGYFHERLAEGQVDPLKAKAIVFRSETQQAAMVVCDLIAASADFAIEVKRMASEQTGIPASNIIVSATHSHTAPDYTKSMYAHLRMPPGADPVDETTTFRSKEQSRNKTWIS